MNRRTPTTAFTLIELLVVIAIIIALLAILLPSMNQAIAVTESAVCRSNNRQIGAAFSAYLADHFGTFPAYRFAENTTAANTGPEVRHHWFDQLRQLTIGGGDEIPDDFALFQCPTDPRYQYDANLISFGYNYTNFGDVYYAVKVQPSISQVSQPSQSLIVADSVGVYSGSTKYWGSVISPLDISVIGGPTGVWNHYPLEARHPNGTASVLFVDGHVDGHDAQSVSTQIRGTATEYWWDVNEGDRYLFFN